MHGKIPRTTTFFGLEPQIEAMIARGILANSGVQIVVAIIGVGVLVLCVPTEFPLIGVGSG
jgi:hypothetical protein